ncbi:MAG: hypothetical protein R3C61_28320 [Bacteroidia bacterium]
MWNLSGSNSSGTSLLRIRHVDFVTPGVRTVSLAVTYRGCTTTSST